jgi:hypothetical protein
MSTISASTTSTTAYKVTADTTGTLVLQTGASPTTAMTISSAQVVNFANAPTVAGSPLATSPGGSTTQVQYNNAGAFAGSSNFVFDGSNLGLGVTPSAWSTYKAIEITAGQALFAYQDSGPTNTVGLLANSYWGGSWLYKQTGPASRFQLVGNTFTWNQAASGTAGTTATFTQAMSLNSGGQLIVRSSLSGAGAITVGNNGGSGDNYGNIGLYTETSLGIGSIRCYDSTSTGLSGSLQWRDNYASLLAPTTNGLGTAGNGGVSFKVYSGGYSDGCVIEPSASMRPGGDNNRTLGAASYRWSIVYAATGTINTSDANYKEQIAPLDEAEKRVAVAIKGLVKKFKMKDAVAEKGDAARIHVGVIAQEVAAAFVAEGLDPTKYALFCEDTWWEKEYTREEAGITELIRQSFDTETEGAEKKTRMGIRYEQLLAFIISAI